MTDAPPEIAVVIARIAASTIWLCFIGWLGFQVGRMLRGD